MDSQPGTSRALVRDQFARAIAERGGTMSFVRSFGTAIGHSQVSSYVAGRNLPSPEVLDTICGAFPEGFRQLVEKARLEPRDRPKTTRSVNSPRDGTGSPGAEFPPIPYVHRGCRWRKSPSRKLVDEANLDRDPIKVRHTLERAAELGQGDPLRCTRCYSHILFDLSVIAFNERRPEEGCQNLLGAVIPIASLEPDLVVAYAEKLAAERIERGELTEAARVADIGLRAVVQSGVLWRRLGIASWHEGRLTAAYAMLQHATSARRPVDKMDVSYFLGQVLLELDLPAAAAEAFGRVAPAGGLHAVAARAALAFACASLKQADAAAAHFAELESTGTPSSWLHYYKARTHELAGRADQAAVSYVRALGGDRDGMPARVLGEIQRRV